MSPAHRLSARSREAIRRAPMPGDWANDAACKGMAPTDGVSDHPFFPSRGKKSTIARAICPGCPVQVQCRTYALRHPVFGVWAALDQKTRVLYRRRQRQAQRRDAS